jgi:hypothetical protein
VGERLRGVRGLGENTQQLALPGVRQVKMRLRSVIESGGPRSTVYGRRVVQIHMATGDRDFPSGSASLLSVQWWPRDARRRGEVDAQNQWRARA